MMLNTKGTSESSDWLDATLRAINSTSNPEFFIQFLNRLSETEKAQVEEWLIPQLLRGDSSEEILIFHLMANINLERKRIHKLMLVYANFIRYFSGKDSSLPSVLLEKVLGQLLIGEVAEKRAESTLQIMIDGLKQALGELEAGDITIDGFKKLVETYYSY